MSDDEVRRIIIIDDNQAIHEDFRMILLKDKKSNELENLEAIHN